MAQVANYTVDNDTGANVRADINNIFAAVQSLNSGSSDPSGTQVAFQLSVNTTSNLLKLRNASNTALVLNGQVTTGTGFVFDDGSGTNVLDQNFAGELITINTDYDVRVHILGGKFLAAMKRPVIEGDFRSNVSQGSKPQNIKLT